MKTWMVLIPVAFGGWAQEPRGGAGQDPAVFRSNVEMVNVVFSVRDRSRAFVSDLSKNDFTLTVDGEPVPIKHFARQTDLPLTAGLAIDASFAAKTTFGQEMAAARQFLHATMRPGDQAMLAGFYANVDLWQKPTASLDALDSVLNNVPQLLPKMRARVKEEERSPAGTMISISCVGGGRLYDAVDAVSRQVLAPLTGRKAIVVLTTERDCGSTDSLEQAARAAQDSDVIIYGLHYANASVSFGRQYLADLSGATGGRSFSVGSQKSVEDAFEAIEAEIRNQYAIGFTPPDTHKKDVEHKIQLRTVKPGLVIQSRRTYFR
jgi:VWFA-related protein